MAKQYAVTGQVRFVNKMVGFLNRFGLGGSNTHTLTTTGRRSGQARSTPVTVPTVDGVRYLVAPYGDVGWVHNVRARPEATLSRAGSVQKITVHEVTPREAGPVLQRYFTDVKIVRPYFDASPDSPLEAFIDQAAQHPVFRIEG